MGYTVRRYLAELFGIFFRWWWAALSGVASIVGALVVPETGVTFHKASIALLILFISLLVFMVVTTTVVSWRWFVAGVHPRVTKIIPGHDGQEHIFVVDTRGSEIAVGQTLALYQEKNETERCIAVLRLTTQRKDGTGLQAEPLWILPVHKLALSKGELQPRDLHVREVEQEVLAFVHKCGESKA